MSESFTISEGCTGSVETVADRCHLVLCVPDVAVAAAGDDRFVYVPLADRLAFAAAVAPDGYQVVPVRLPRAECPVCEHEYALTRSGGMRRHADPTTTWYRDCAGSGVQPKAATS